ncbi:MAG: type II toxin-antitoxin system PemK/MazF family toxin [Nocardioidaceae bacterium]
MRFGSFGRRASRVVRRQLRQRRRPAPPSYLPTVNTSTTDAPTATPTVVGPGPSSEAAKRSGPDASPAVLGVSSELKVEYTPTPDGQPDPGEVVWTWVPYEDDPAQGKDRPVLIIGRQGDSLAGLMLSSQDHDVDAADEARWGRYWMDVGSGLWDSSGRPSEVRLNRLVPVDPASVRREGATLDQAMFDQVIDAARPHLP